MKVSIYSRNNSVKESSDDLSVLRKALELRGIEVVEQWTPEQSIDMMISVGGDGTLLSAVHHIGPCGIPVVGINFGHLGFLTTAGRDDIDSLADSLQNGRYTIEQRTMLEVQIDSQNADKEILYALNEVYLHRVDSGSLLHTSVSVDGQKVATYAGDGLIVATPTGSTAYSLSCGGPILAPGCGAIVVTPIAAHTLTQRPLILSDGVCLRLRDQNSTVSYTVGVDSTVRSVVGDSVIQVRKADYSTSLVRIEKQDFFSAIRDKLMWGL